MNSEKWFIVKNDKGKFCPRISNNNVGPYWPFGPAEFDDLEMAKQVLKTAKEYLDKKRIESEETVVFEL